MKHRKGWALIMAVLLLLCGRTPSGAAGNYGNVYGSCKKLNGRTVIVSVFASDARTRWNWDKKEDYDHYLHTWRMLRSAVQWIQKNAARYGAKTELLWDFQNTPYLYWEVTFDQNLQGIENADYSAMKQCIEDSLYPEFLARHFETDSILYMFYFNSTKTGKWKSYSFNYNGYALSEYTSRPKNRFDECCVIFTRGYDLVTTARSYAHEIMHCFGAPDLYIPYDDYQISQSFADWYSSQYPNDIMVTGRVDRGESIDCELTEVTAYYSGLISRSPIAERWNLKPSDFEAIGY